MLNPELEILLEIQDLQTLRRDVAKPDAATAGLAEGAEARAARLEARIIEREQSLSPRVLATYQRVARRHERVVVPVLNGVCYGCFVHVATSRGHDTDRRAELQNCESCGRFLYYADV